MISRVSIRNFRSIESADVDLAPITVLYGPTASGKSSLLYATQVLRNFVLNPNRQADGYFHLGFMDLGGFDACVFNHDANRQVSVSITSADEGGNITYGLTFGKAKGTVELEVAPASLMTALVGGGTISLSAEIAIPYGMNQTFPFTWKANDDQEYTINWTGIACNVVPKAAPTTETLQKAQEIATLLNSSSEVLKGIDIAPHKRGFFKPNYTPTPASTTPTTEDEVASIIINDPHLAGRISVYTEEIFGRDFRLYQPPGTATAFFQTTDKKSRIPVYLVNDGFGINQVIYLLAKMLRVDVNVILIEEPEVHLHPTVLRNFARALCTFVREEKRQVILATHSELFLCSLLAVVAEGNLQTDEIKCYLASKDKKSTSYKEQRVQQSGQIEGGLSAFVEAEIEDLKKFLGVK